MRVCFPDDMFRNGISLFHYGFFFVKTEKRKYGTGVAALKVPAVMTVCVILYLYRTIYVICRIVIRNAR